eukprot:2773412-Alexandrium_andersonii.AAC.1
METYLEEVAFCIFEDHNAGKWHNPRGNTEPFRDVFGLEHQHARRSADTPAATEGQGQRAQPKGAC